MPLSIGDIAVILQAAWLLYRDCYKISRGAPQDFKLLLDELSTLKNSIQVLYEEIQDSSSTLCRSGEERVNMAKEMMRRVKETLDGLQKFAEKYKNTIGDATDKVSKRKTVWARIRWSMDAPDINSLRSELVYHNGIMSLLLNAAANSSLARIENAHTQLQNDISEIRRRLSDPTCLQSQGKLQNVGVETMTKRAIGPLLALAFIKDAEARRPWSHTGIEDWINAGKWWLQKAQFDLYSNPKVVSKQGYLDLVKASWILVDIISVHPQINVLSMETQYVIKVLSKTILEEFDRIESNNLVIPQLEDIGDSDADGLDICIWQVKHKAPALMPSGRPWGSFGEGMSWTIDTSETILFQRPAILQITKQDMTLQLPDKISPEETPVMVLFLMQKIEPKFRILCLDQSASIVLNLDLHEYHKPDRDAKIAFFNHLRNDYKSFKSSFSPASYADSPYERTYYLMNFSTLDDSQRFATVMAAVTWYYHQLSAAPVPHGEVISFLILFASATLGWKVALDMVPATYLQQPRTRDPNGTEKHERVRDLLQEMSQHIAYEIQTSLDGITRFYQHARYPGQLTYFTYQARLIFKALNSNHVGLLFLLSELGMYSQKDIEEAAQSALRQGSDHVPIARLLLTLCRGSASYERQSTGLAKNFRY